MVADESGGTHIVGQIDTQQLPSRCRLGSEFAPVSDECHHFRTTRDAFPGARERQDWITLDRGPNIFADELTRFAAESGDRRIAALARRVAAPVTVAVHGRAGVGRSTVAAALSAARVSVCASESASDVEVDVDVFVIAEVLKPEDRAAVAATRRPAVVVLNKADLCGFTRGGPIAAAEARAEHYRRLTGLPTVPMVAQLAVADVDAELVAALDILAAEPADLSSVDRFVECEHRVPRAARQRLLATLDVFGIAHAVLAIRTSGAAAIGPQGRRATDLAAVLRRLSRTDAVAAHIGAVGAEAVYRRVGDAMGELERLAVGDQQVAAFCRGDGVVLARMQAAVDVVEGVGLTVDTGDDAHAHLSRAVRWRNYSCGPVTSVHRSCGVDISRGSLRLLARTAKGGSGW